LLQHAHSHRPPSAVLSIHQVIRPWSCCLRPSLWITVSTFDWLPLYTYSPCRYRLRPWCRECHLLSDFPSHCRRHPSLCIAYPRCTPRYPRPDLCCSVGRLYSRLLSRNTWFFEERLFWTRNRWYTLLAVGLWTWTVPMSLYHFDLYMFSRL
jgi:hypothetical protein